MSIIKPIFGGALSGLFGLYLFHLTLKSWNIETSVRVKIAELVLSNSIVQSSILLAVIGVLIAVYWSSLATDDTRNKLRSLIWAIAAVITAGFVSGLIALSFLVFNVNELFVAALTLHIIAIGATILITVISVLMTVGWIRKPRTST